MGSKKFKGKLCAYCAERTATGADHVVCREFFPPDARDGLPKAPACNECNGRKASLEQEFTTVLPFGSVHPTALSGQMDVLGRRLAKNEPLHRELLTGAKAVWVIDDASMAPSIALPFRGERFVELCRLILRGLAWHEWRTVVPKDYLVEVLTLEPEVFAAFADTVLRLVAGSRIERTLARGGLWYAGARARDDAALTIWHLRIYENLGLGGAPDESGRIEQLEIVGLTAPPSLRATLARLTGDRTGT